MTAADSANKLIVDAYCSVQKSIAVEHRAWWCHSPFGVGGMTWDAAIRNLAENDFTAIMPNMLWGGVAYYNSEALPVYKDINEKGDQIELYVKACKKYGVKCHIWKFWCEKGILILFVLWIICHQTGSLAHSLTSAGVVGDVPCYPGIGVSCWLPKDDICKLIDQINITRKLHTGGFTIFNYGNSEAKDVVPLCGHGITK